MTTTADATSTHDPELPSDLPEFVVATTRYPRAAIMPEVRRLSKVSNWRSAATIAWQWVLIFAAGTLAVQTGHWAAYLLAFLVIGSRQQALGILVHDATHYSLFTNRTVNDIAGDLFVGFPVNISTTLYRSTHFPHHRLTNTPDDPDYEYQVTDPDWQWPKTRWEAVKVLLKSMFVINIRSAVKVANRWAPGMNLFTPITPAYPLRARVLFVAVTIGIYAVLIYTGLIWQALLLWMVPALTVVNLTNRMRAMAEHVVVPGTHELNTTRTVIPNLLERWFICPLGINYHIEHHVFPSVPFYNVPKLHKLLMQDPWYRASAHLNRGYFNLRHGFLRELLTTEAEHQALLSGRADKAESPRPASTRARVATTLPPPDATSAR
ncbi:MAG: fatty acid desaturase family protein [Pirellulales bacterium]|nr:fatty acid desaturase family protein [Pirellulales bacterium]